MMNTEDPMKPKKNPFVLYALIALIVYIGLFKAFGATQFDFTDIITSLKPYLPHSLALLGSFVFTLLAYLKNENVYRLWGALFGLVSVATYFPLSLAMIVPTGLLGWAWYNENH